ncbi:TPA: helix-turn-helix domain-containing protein [Pasteurella multocida]|nr:helix-turn-helix domain-containing protein [Pasteurella multocida]
MSSKLLGHVWDLDLPDHATKLVLLRLADSANDETGECWPSLKHIQDKCNIKSKNTIRRALEVLEQLGLLVVIKRKLSAKQNTSNLYRLNIKKILEPNSVNLKLRGGSNSELGGSNSELGGGSNSEPRTNNSFEPINELNTPLPPKSELACSEEKNLSQAQELLAHYNEIAKSHCKDSSPFLPLLEKNHYTVDEIKLVINWVLTCWNRRNGKAAKPKNICVKSRFDGYLSDAITWNERRSLCKDVVDAYNEILGDRLVPMDEVDQLAESQISALLPHLARQNIDGFRSYFQAFSDNAREYYFRPENKYGFSYLMKPETLFKTRRGEL